MREFSTQHSFRLQVNIYPLNRFNGYQSIDGVDIKLILYKSERIKVNGHKNTYLKSEDVEIQNFNLLETSTVMWTRLKERIHCDR